jgi:GxxExxY protein
MAALREACLHIMGEHSTGHTECFYEKMISQFLYARNIPFITQVDCFIQTESTQVLVGRIDMEIDHAILVELKVGPRIRRADVRQIMKYVRARKASGMDVQLAVVICFRIDGKVQFYETAL